MGDRPRLPGFCCICCETHFLCDPCDLIAAAAVEASRQAGYAEILAQAREASKRPRKWRPPPTDNEVDDELYRQEGWEFTPDGWR